MSLRKKVSLIIYRFQERGLEVFLVNDPAQNDVWDIPCGELNNSTPQQDSFIELDPVQDANGTAEEGLAVEGDWHQIPSLKSMLYKDVLQLKDKIGGLENGTFLSVKEAFKKVLPHQYEMLKELKDILRDRNSLRDL